MTQTIGAVQAASMLLAGLFTGLKFHLPFLPVCALFCTGLAGGIFFYLRGKDYVLDQRPKRLSRLFVCLAIFSLGMARTLIPSGENAVTDIKNLAGSRLEGLTGHLIAPPVITRSRTTLRIELDNEQPGIDFPASGKLLLVFYRELDGKFQYGDRLSFSGTVVLPPDSSTGFSYRDYLERDGITAMINNPAVEKLPGFTGSSLRAGIFRLRSVLVNRVYRLFPDPAGSLMAGILLGDESRISSDIDRDFQKTGTSHIIAISGANFTLLTWILLRIIRRLVPQWWSPALLIPFIAFYTVLVGGSSAVVRAAIMCSLSILGMVLGRTGNGINNLALTAAVMCLRKPVLLFDLGFQLSAAATLGILMFSDPLCGIVRNILSKLFPKIDEGTLTAAVNILNDLCLMSVSAQIFTLWISAKAFGQISLISLPANFLIAPFQPMIMLGGFAALGLSFLFYPLGAGAAWIIWAAPALTISIVQRCADIRWGAIYSDLQPVHAWLIIGTIILIWIERQKIRFSIQKRQYQPYAALLLLFAAVLIWGNVSDRLNRRSEIEFRQTASSMLLTVRSPENRYFIIGDGLTNYGGQDALKRTFLPLVRLPAAAWIDIPEAWMRREFLTSGAADGLSVFFLNGGSVNSDPAGPESLDSGYTFCADGLRLRFLTAYLGKRAWSIENTRMRLLIPNGIPPERIFSPAKTNGEAYDAVILGRRDRKDLWAGFGPKLLDVSDRPDTAFILSEDSLSIRTK